MSMMPNTMRDFYEWVKTRDPDELYDYQDYNSCARARYSRDRGIVYGSADCVDRNDIEIASMQENDPCKDKHYLSMRGLRKEIEEHWL